MAKQEAQTRTGQDHGPSWNSKPDKKGTGNAPRSDHIQHTTMLALARVGPAEIEIRGKPPARRRRGLSEETKGRITELHRAGRSAYAISKELGVAYTTARAHVRALEAA